MNSIGASQNEIIITSGATEANNLALLGVTGGASNSSARTIISSPLEHKAVLEPLTFLTEEAGWKTEWLPNSPTGELALQALEKALKKGAFLVSLMAVNNEIGTINPISEMAQLAHSFGTLFH
ncbi:MAG: aminotransferase class V-fold PLP-dependent enzyme, partial [Rectinemataceae bacterium]|nr:aminotransferase class V-fold PLP-dependent enzyme [Rectinemataceae bacterium]